MTGHIKSVIYDICFGKTEINEKRNFKWNFIAGIINALEAIIMTMIVTRTTNIQDAGILTIAFAVGNLFMTVGKFGTRNYQVTDQSEEFAFGDYCKARIFSTFCMLIFLLVYCVYSRIILGSSITKLLVIVFITLIYAIEVIEDVFCGMYQQKGRLDVASIIFSIRWMFSIFVYGIVITFSKNLLLAIFCAFLICFFIFTILIQLTYKEFHVTFKSKGSWQSVIKNCVPLFAGAFLMMYLTNSPKYAIEKYLSDEMQACYGFISMPLFAMELLNNFLYQPKLADLSRCWNNKELSDFRKYIVKQCVILLVLSCVVLLGAYLIGIPILSIIYNYKLDSYKTDLIMIMIGSMLLAFTGFFAVVLTIMRKQNHMMFCYIAVSLIMGVAMNQGVKNWQIRGGTVVFDIIMMLLSSSLGVVVIVQYLKRKNNWEKKNNYDEGYE